MYRAVLDTNVLISAFATPTGIPGQIYKTWQTEKFRLILSVYILNEFGRVSRRLRFSDKEILDIIAKFYKLAEIVEPAGVRVPGIDRNDLPIIGTAVAGSADTLVTGDKMLLALSHYKSIKILSPANFLKLLQ